MESLEDHTKTQALLFERDFGCDAPDAPPHLYVQCNLGGISV
jgi:hypothetical protein